MTSRVAWVLTGLVIAAAGQAYASEPDAKRGAEFYRACVACHSLEPGVHLTGPSLAGLWATPAGKIEDFARYSNGLKSSDFRWDADTLNAWLADPAAMVPGTYMLFRGIESDDDRAHLIAFLAIAMAPGGGKAVVERGLAPSDYVRGPQPDPLAPAPDDARVTAVRHCGDSYFITKADGTDVPFWEMNVRLKVDTRATGPEPGKPVVARAGMTGDRVSVIFSSIEELERFVEEQC